MSPAELLWLEIELDTYRALFAELRAILECPGFSPDQLMQSIKLLSERLSSAPLPQDQSS